MPLNYQDHSPKERPGLGTMKHTKPDTQKSSSKSVLGHVTICTIKPIVTSVPTEVKNNEQESKINELIKLVQMLIDEKVNSSKTIQESKHVIPQFESSKSVNSSKMSQEAKPKGQNTDSSKSVRLKPLQKPKLKCELCFHKDDFTYDCYRILYCMKCKKEDHRTSYYNMYVASLKNSENYKAQPYQYASPSNQILKAKAKPFPPCTHYGFNDYRPDACRMYPECEICERNDHATSNTICYSCQRRCPS
ncbi:hypothetical protein Tco_0513331 [Tanacetum coccineum]